MKNSTKYFLFPIESDPVKWAGRLVGSWTRFVIWASLFSYLIYDIVMNAGERGPERAIYGALLIILFQLISLYGLRWLYLEVAKKEVD